MFPGMGNPKQMQAMMKQLGIKSNPVEAHKVIIETGNKKIIIDQPQITAIEMQGQKTYTIMGNERVEESGNEEDIALIVQQTGVSKEQAQKALEENENDLAKTVNALKKK